MAAAGAGRPAQCCCCWFDLELWIVSLDLTVWRGGGAGRLFTASANNVTAVGARVARAAFALAQKLRPRSAHGGSRRVRGAIRARLLCGPGGPGTLGRGGAGPGLAAGAGRAARGRSGKAAARPGAGPGCRLPWPRLVSRGLALFAPSTCCGRRRCCPSGQRLEPEAARGCVPGARCCRALPSCAPNAAWAHLGTSGVSVAQGLHWQAAGPNLEARLGFSLPSAGEEVGAGVSGRRLGDTRVAGEGDTRVGGCGILG